jgi:hypothetical protein
MASAASEYAQYFKEDNQVKAGIKQADGKLLDISGLVRFIENDRLTLEVVGNDLPGRVDADEGATVYLTFWTGWSLCRCNAVLAQKIYGRRVFLQLTGQVIEKQTRDFFRLDVAIPLKYEIPETQHHSEIEQLWVSVREELTELPAPIFAPSADGFKVVRWNGSGEIPPCQVNLSGGGMRFRTREYLEPHTLVMVNMFLPLNQPRVLPVVAEVLRCSEIVLGREKGQSYITACRYHFINEKDREGIIAFIFAEQRRILNSFAGKR